MDLSFLHEKQGTLTEFADEVKSIHCKTGVDESLIIESILDRLREGYTIKDAAGFVEINIWMNMIKSATSNLT